MATGFSVVEERSAGGFVSGLPQLLDFPAGVVSEAREKRHLLPRHLVTCLPALVETVNIAAVSTLVGAMGGLVLSLLSRRGRARWPRLIPLAWWDRDHPRLRAALHDFRTLPAAAFLDRHGG
jgi:phosphonate transport system permease protein